MVKVVAFVADFVAKACSKAAGRWYRSRDLAEREAAILVQVHGERARTIAREQAFDAAPGDQPQRWRVVRCVEGLLGIASRLDVGTRMGLDDRESG
jgi:hypothetical protein